MTLHETSALDTTNVEEAFMNILTRKPNRSLFPIRVVICVMRILGYTVTNYHLFTEIYKSKSNNNEVVPAVHVESEPTIKLKQPVPTLTASEIKKQYKCCSQSQ